MSIATAVHRLRIAGLALAIMVDSPAQAEDLLPSVAVAARETFDVFGVPMGREHGTVALNKLQLSATMRGERLGLPGWSLHAQVFRFDGSSLSRRLGDLQTADNIEAVPVTRLFEAYLARMWGSDRKSIAVRLGLIDLNNQFDSIDPASVMLNSSHGIAPDLSRSGVSGPSIYPVTAAGSTVTWVHSPRWTFRLGLFDGVAGSPGRPRAFVAERLKAADGLLLISQADWQLGKDSRLEFGAWDYTARHVGPSGRLALDRGAYASIEAPGPLLPRLSLWLRGGVASGAAQVVQAYLGGGVVQQGTVPGRPDDKLGVAIAHAIVGGDVAHELGLHRAETSVELTYQAKISRRFLIQPDVDYVRHPAGSAHAPDSLGLGMRFVLVGASPARMEASDPGDPTIPPDGAQSGSPE